MKLFEFTTRRFGWDSFYVMSTSEEEAIQALCSLENFSMNFWNDNKHMYKIYTYGENEPIWCENA